MANSDWNNIPESTQNRFLSEFSKKIQPYPILTKTLSMPMERKKVGKWEALWLKLTFRKPPMVYVLPQSLGDTVTFKRPQPYTKKPPEGG